MHAIVPLAADVANVISDINLCSVGSEFESDLWRCNKSCIPFRLSMRDTVVLFAYFDSKSQ